MQMKQWAALVVSRNRPLQIMKIYKIKRERDAVIDKRIKGRGGDKAVQRESDPPPSCLAFKISSHLGDEINKTKLKQGRKTGLEAATKAPAENAAERFCDIFHAVRSELITKPSLFERSEGLVKSYSHATCGETEERGVMRRVP